MWRTGLNIKTRDCDTRWPSPDSCSDCSPLRWFTSCHSCHPFSLLLTLYILTIKYHQNQSDPAGRKWSVIPAAVSGDSLSSPAACGQWSPPRPSPLWEDVVRVWSTGHSLQAKQGWNPLVANRNVSEMFNSARPSPYPWLNHWRETFLNK